MKPTLNEHAHALANTAATFFNRVVGLSKEVRPDEKERTGMQVFIREIGTDNIALFSASKPSERAQFFAVEKAVRSAMLGQAASQNSEDPDKMQFPGSITITLDDGTQFQASTSGLKSYEDVANSILMLSDTVQWPIEAVIKNVRDHGGMLPDFLSDQQHYLCQILDSYDKRRV